MKGRVGGLTPWRGVRDAIKRARDMASQARMRCLGVSSCLRRQGREFSFVAHWSAVRETGELEPGGYGLENSAQVRWRRDEGPEPQLKDVLSHEGERRVFQVTEVARKTGSLEWLVSVEEVK